METWNSLRYFINRGVGSFRLRFPKLPTSGVTGGFSRSLAPTHPLAAETAIQLLNMHDKLPDMPMDLLEVNARRAARNVLKRERRSRRH